jgi:hypothetical protein
MDMLFILIVITSFIIILLFLNNNNTIENWNPEVGGLYGAKSCYHDRDCREINSSTGYFSNIDYDTGKTCVMTHPNENRCSYSAGRADYRCVSNEIAQKYYYNN